MTTFSANLGYLWKDRSLPEAIHAAKAAGFDAVECHLPYDTAPSVTLAALQETGLVMLGINTRYGNTAAGEVGLSAVPGREEEARRFIDEAIAYACETRAKNIHVMAGLAAGNEARKTYITNLRYACAKAAPLDLTILIEPLNHYDNPGYFLSTSGQAADLINEIAAANLKLMFDCYHVQLMEGDLSNRLSQLLPVIGHIQFASVPDRGPPDHGELSYRHIFRELDKLGYSSPLGAEYRPPGETDASLGWMATYR